MRILLYNPPAKTRYVRDNYCCYSAKAGYCWEPLDLAMLSGILAQRHSIEVCDAIADPRRERLLSGHYDAIIFMTGCASWNDDRRHLEALAARMKCLMIGLGDIVLAYPEIMFQDAPFLNAVILNFTGMQILEYLEAPASGKVIDNIIYRMNDSLMRGQRLTQKKVDIPTPKHALFPLKRYSISIGKKALFATTATSFGCNFCCAFCVCNILPIEFRSVENVMEELRYIASLGIPEVYFYDPNFIADRSRVSALCDCLIHENLGLKWFCNVTCIGVDEELVTLMRRAGCHTVMIGIESGDERLLKRYKYGLTPQQIGTTVEQFKKHTIRVLGYFLIGLPGETKETVQATIDFACALDLDAASFNIPSPLPATALWAEIQSVPGDDTEVVTGPDRSIEASFVTQDLTKAQIKKLHGYAYRKFYLRPRYIMRELFLIRSYHELKNIAYGVIRLGYKYFFNGEKQ